MAVSERVLLQRFPQGVFIFFQVGGDILPLVALLLLASALLVPYVSLVLFSRGGIAGGPGACWASSVAGLSGSLAWYLLGYLPTSKSLVGFGAPGILGSVHPFVIGLLFSVAGMIAGILLERSPAPSEVPEQG